ncbi:maleylpyruvate isomerase N-terminal domain-containing protein [Lentzea nigeriaca]|uniref:maleylpyruvate isomerase N-terminal domain-containing protein n=1 Tax=Lentzea nigeriaca TaxID=1128665 RepID=UPI00195CD477|nr:maleylpyruvate isomerase N-terminal domain-containing protein [Lentzea nigeriaca]MBM7858613.1 hypothetical protein [Lentzea nigeriaca]
MTVTADDLDLAINAVESTLKPAVGQDWLTASGTGEWTARATAEHIGDCLISYAGQLIAAPQDRYARFMAVADANASAPELLEFLVLSGRLLASVVRTCSPTTRAYHPTGRSDPEGFAAMGCVEMLVHGHDLALGLGLRLTPPSQMCHNVIARLFPHTAATLTDIDPWTALLWSTNRVQLPGQPEQNDWRWHGNPL